MKRLIVIVLTILSFYQSNSKENQLDVDENGKFVFTQSELQGILKMIQLVDETITHKTGIPEIEKAYHYYFEELKGLALCGKVFPVFITDSIKFRFLKDMNKDSFDAIWKFYDVIPSEREHLSSQTKTILGLNLQGNFIKYLEKTGESDLRFKDFLDIIQAAGDISPSLIVWVPVHHEEFDFSLFKTRLWATVLLLRCYSGFQKELNR